MSILPTIADGVGGLSLALGGISLMNQAYLVLSTKRAQGRIVGWTDEDNRRFRARLAFTPPDGVPREVPAVDRGFASDRDAQPAGTEVGVRYKPGDPDWATFDQSGWGAWGPSLGFVLVGVAGFFLGTILH
jgi:hypothetical protein